jgi:hypothetical protein
MLSAPFFPRIGRCSRSGPIVDGELEAYVDPLITTNPRLFSVWGARHRGELQGGPRRSARSQRQSAQVWEHERGHRAHLLDNSQCSY